MEINDLYNDWLKFELKRKLIKIMWRSRFYYVTLFDVIKVCQSKIKLVATPLIWRIEAERRFHNGHLQKRRPFLYLQTHNYWLQCYF